MSPQGRAKSATLLLMACGLFLALDLPGAVAGGKKRPRSEPATASSKGKPALLLEPMQLVEVDLPDGKSNDFSRTFQARLHTRLAQSGRYVILTPAPSSTRKRALKEELPPPFWVGHPVPPAGIVRIHVDALNFETGARGSRLFYGFDERLHNKFNDGSGPRNELRSAGTFGHSFDRKGSEPWDSLSGLDLGENVSLDLLFGWLGFRYATYRSQLRLRVELEAPFIGRHDFRAIETRGKGKLRGLSGGAFSWNFEFLSARKDAMIQAIDKAFEQSLAAIERGIGELPLTAIIDNIDSDGTAYLGTGTNSEIPAGTRYVAIEDAALEFEAVSAVPSGTIAKLRSGSLASVRTGTILLEKQAAKAPVAPKAALRSLLSTSEPVLSATETVTAPEQDYGSEKVGRFRQFWRNLGKLVALPYRVWRYHQYDRTYKREADTNADSVGTWAQAGSIAEWGEQARQSAWGRQIGLNLVPELRHEPVVAVIDSGVDYNHPYLHPLLWLNPSPTHDPSGRKDRYGWDFISGDSRPYDDHYHGTRLASLVAAVAPSARIMPLKVFTPWGLTSSAAVLGAFHYAVDHGASVILCGWASFKPSEALEEGVRYAEARGIPVVASAGDHGQALENVPTYPGALSETHENVVTVAALDNKGQLLERSAWGTRHVTLAAPGKDLRVAEPRGMESTASGADVAAALVAGALARLPESGKTALPWAEKIESISEVSPALADKVREGRMLRLRD